MQVVDKPSPSTSFFAVPSIKRRPWGLLSLILNILPVAGVGSIIVGIKGAHNGILIVGIVQVAIDVSAVALDYFKPASWLFPIIFLVWAWSIIWGLRIYIASSK